MLKLIGEKSGIEIEVLDYQDPSAECRDDRNWLNCNVRAHIGCARLEVDCMIQTYDVRYLYEGLQGTSESFVWSFPEDEISIEFGMKNGVLSIAKFRYRKESSEEGIAVSFNLLKLGRTRKELLESVCDTMMQYPVLD